MQRLIGALHRFLDDIWGRAALVVLGCLLAQMGLAYGYVFPALARDILGEMGWSRSEFSFARLPQLAAMAAASPFVGLLSVRYGARRVIVCSIVLLGSVFLLFPRVEDLYAYYALMMVAGLALTGVGDITVSHAVSQWVVRSRGFALGIVYAGSNLGGVILVPAIVAISAESDWRNALFFMGLGAFGLLLPAAGLLIREKTKAERSVAAATAPARGATSSRIETDADLSLRAALRTRSFWILFFSLFAFFFYFLALLEHMVLHFTDHGMERDDAVRLYATAIGLGIWSKLLLGLVADRIPEKQSMLIDYGALALSSLVLLVAPTSALAWLFVISFGFSYAARDVVYPLIVTACFGARWMAPIYGALMPTLLLGASGPLFAAAIHDRSGSYDLAFQIFALLNAAALVALFFLRDERRVRPGNMASATEDMDTQR